MHRSFFNMLIFICAVCINYISAFDLRKNLLGKHVLLAEDNDLNAEIAVTVLEEKGLVIERVKDGVQCLNRIEQMLPGTYDLILMDIQIGAIQKLDE